MIFKGSCSDADSPLRSLVSVKRLAIVIRKAPLSLSGASNLGPLYASLPSRPLAEFLNRNGISAIALLQCVAFIDVRARSTLAAQNKTCSMLHELPRWLSQSGLGTTPCYTGRVLLLSSQTVASNASRLFSWLRGFTWPPPEWGPHASISSETTESCTRSLSSRNTPSMVVPPACW